MAKLDPDNYKSALDVMDERAAAEKKRKREEEADISPPPEQLEKPREGLKTDDRKSKKRKIGMSDTLSPANEGLALKHESKETEEQRKQRKADKKAAKRERKQAKTAKAKEKRDRLKANKQESVSNEPKRRKTASGQANEDDEDDQSEDDVDMTDAIDLHVGDTTMTEADGALSASPSPPAESSVMSPEIHSGSSSVSSIVPPTTAEPGPLQTKSALNVDEKPLYTKQTPSEAQKASQEARERLQARVAELRAARKADGPDGREPRNRQELLEQRRRKEEARKAAKKEQRRKEKEEEAQKQDEEIARRFSPGGSGSLLASPMSPMEPVNNFSFGRVAFGDGAQADATLSSLLDPKKHKGPADAATALKAAQNKASRLSGFDEAKRKDIEEKDMWLNAKKKAHGERVRDDTSLLKKALKRQESTKKKSENEWQGRIEGVAKGQEIRQKKREANLQKRRDEKGNHGKTNNSKAKKMKRPGFEGSFKGRTGGGKKK